MQGVRPKRADTKGKYGVKEYWKPILHKKWTFPLRISLVNVTKSTVSWNPRFGHIYWRNPWWKTRCQHTENLYEKLHCTQGMAIRNFSLSVYSSQQTSCVFLSPVSYEKKPRLPVWNMPEYWFSGPRIFPYSGMFYAVQ